MTPIGKLITNEDFRLRMVAVHHSWAMQYLRERNHSYTAIQLNAARELLDEARELRILRGGETTWT